MISPWLTGGCRRRGPRRIEVEALAHGRAFLPDREVGGTGVLVLDAFVRAELLDLVQHGLELADHDHVAVDPQEPRRRDVRVPFELLRHRTLVRVDGNTAQIEFFAPPDLFRNDHQLLRHGNSFPSRLSAAALLMHFDSPQPKRRKNVL
jgi:hypothetical protein